MNGFGVGTLADRRVVIYANEQPKEAIARVEAGFYEHDRDDD